MHILILTGSPHKNGTTAALVDAFCEGAQSAGHHIARLDAARLAVNPCKGCLYCKSHGLTCIQQDQMAEVYPPLLAADAVVFVTPVYYLGMTAQLKAVLDRFFAVNSALRKSPKKMYLLAASTMEDAYATDSMEASFRAACRYLRWEYAGSVLARGCPTRAEVEKTDFLSKARDLGASL